MVADFQTDDEQLQQLKNWWNEHGTALIVTVVIAVGAYFGWMGWRQYSENYAFEASALYGELLESSLTAEGENLTDEKYATAQYLIAQLQNDYSRSMYALNASLVAAKLAVDKSDLETAEQQLKLAQNLADDDTRAIVDFRLAKIYLAKDQYDEALQLATYDKDDSMKPLFADLRGDIELAKGNSDAARTAYQQALDALDNSNRSQKQFLEIKLSDLEVGDQS